MTDQRLNLLGYSFRTVSPKGGIVPKDAPIGERRDGGCSLFTIELTPNIEVVTSRN